MRTAQGRSISRSLGMNHKEVDTYFELLSATLKQYRFDEEPRKIFNMDETGLQLNNKPTKVVATKGARDVHKLTSNEKGETISLIACCNAEGNFLPPYVIFRGKNKKKEFEDNMPPGSVIEMSPESAYVKTSIFLSWIKNHFLPRKGTSPVLLIVDGHASHCSDVKVLDFLAENEIILLCLPSHTTHWLQPLDRTFFKPLKTYWNEACATWLRNHPGRKITRLQFGELLSASWGPSATQKNATAGFAACGIHPCDQSKIPEYAFSVSDNMIGERHGTTSEIVHQNPQENPHPVNDLPTTSHELTAHQENEAEPSGTSFENISPIPAIPGLSKPNVRKQHAEIVTSPEVRERKRQKLKEKLEKQNKLQKKEKRTAVKAKKASQKRRIRDNCSSSSSEEYGNTVSDHSSDNIASDSDDFCAVCNGYYHDKKGPKVDWLCCITCKKWLHETCTPYQHQCENCHKN